MEIENDCAKVFLVQVNESELSHEKREVICK